VVGPGIPTTVVGTDVDPEPPTIGTVSDQDGPRRNRVDPWGDLHAVNARGVFTGIRGCVVDDRVQVVRHHGSTLWIICRTAYRGWRWPPARPRRWTPLFFLDDAVALAAGAPPADVGTTTPTGRLLPFSFNGWLAPQPRPAEAATVLTPPTTVLALGHGFRPPRTERGLTDYDRSGPAAGADGKAMITAACPLDLASRRSRVSSGQSIASARAT
jgi:hypothetical protein